MRQNTCFQRRPLHTLQALQQLRRMPGEAKLLDAALHHVRWGCSRRCLLARLPASSSLIPLSFFSLIGCAAQPGMLQCAADILAAPSGAVQAASCLARRRLATASPAQRCYPHPQGAARHQRYSPGARPRPAQHCREASGHRSGCHAGPRSPVSCGPAGRGGGDDASWRPPAGGRVPAPL